MPEAYPVRISLDAGLELWRPEIQYVFDVLERWYWIKSDPAAKRAIHYGVEPPVDCVWVPSVLLPSCILAKEDGLHLNRKQLASVIAASRTILPIQSQDAGRLGYDAIGLMFLMLSRIEERDHPALDRYDRFPFHAALATELKSDLRPLADTAARDLVRLIGGERVIAPRTEYSVRLTHDVDRLRGYHNLTDPIRHALGDLAKRGQPLRALRRLRDGYFGGEPWRSFRDIISMSEAKGLRSHFYFMGPTLVPSDSPYALHWPEQLRAVVDEIDRLGHGIGFHPGHATPEDGAEWNRQKAGLERLLDRVLVEGRQHMLRYRIDRTPDIWADGGMQLDLTLGFPERTGFRSGTCRRYPAYSLARRKRLSVDRLDTAVMDFGLFGGKYRNLSLDEAMAESLTARDVCREFGGELVVLFHTGQPAGLARKHYRQLLAAL